MVSEPTKMKGFHKKSLPYVRCVLHLSCVVHGPIYSRFMGCTVNGFLFIRGIQQEYSSKPLKHSIIERILVFKR